jgi:4-amino-4-deoxy-L-arabinose transferase-like glycosyltransferase
MHIGWLNLRNRLLDTPVWILFPFLLLLFNSISGFDGLYGQDSFEYLRYSRALHQFFISGALPGNFWWPPFYAALGAVFSFILNDILSLQFVSFAGYGLAIFFLEKIFVRLYPDNRQDLRLYVLLFFCLSPFLMRYASTVMSETLCIAFITGFYYYYLLYLDSKNLKHLILMAVLGCAAVNTRFPAAVVILIPVIHAFILFMKNFKPVSLIYILLIGLAIFIPDFLLHLFNSNPISDQPHFINWSFMNYFHRSFSTTDGLLSYPLPNIIYVFSSLAHPGFIFTGGIMVILFRIMTVKRPFFLITGASILLYALFLAGLTFQNDRVLLLTFPLILIIFSGTYFKISSYLKVKTGSWLKVTAILVIIIQIGLFYKAYRPFYENNRIIKTVTSEVLKYPGKKIYTFGIDMALKAYGADNEIINMWESRIPEFEPGSLVLFNYNAFLSQWKGLNPILNWDAVNGAHNLKSLENFPGGWELYEITN